MRAAPKKLPLSAILLAAAVRSQISGHEDRIFNLHLPANPMKSKYGNWSEWQNPDFVAKADQQPTVFQRKRLPDSIQGGLPAPIAAPKLSLKAHGLPPVRRK